MKKELRNRILTYNKNVAQQKAKATDMDVLIAAFAKLPPGQLKKVMTADVLEILQKYGIETALRVALVGRVDPRFTVPKKFECDAFGLYFFDIDDKTLPLYGTEHFKRDMTVAGEMYRRLLPMLESEDEEERLVAARAFRVGLAALEGREIDA